MIRALVALCSVVALAGRAYADGGEAFRAVTQRAAAGDPHAIEAFEALGRARPVTRWTDDAWAEAARLAERAGDFDRARRDLGEAIAIGSDAQLVRRARNDLERLGAISGPAGEWSQVAAEHERLVTRAARGGDPHDALEALEALVRAHPGYPRGVAARVTLARAWEEEGELGRALGWLRDAVRMSPAGARDVARVPLVRTLIRHRELAAARAELARVTDRASRLGLERDLATAARRAKIRWGIGALVVGLVGLAVAVLRRRAASWREVLRGLARPPAEVVYLVPIGAVVAAFSTTGNPLVARAVILIVVAGSAIAWISGAVLEAVRRRGPLGGRRAVVHAGCVAAAVLAAVYLIIDHTRLIDLVAETWRTGPASR